MGQFIQGVDRLKVEFNSSVLILHHTGHDQSHERGSTSLGGACDTIYKLEADKTTHTLTLTNEKMKDGREADPIDLGFREVAVSRRIFDDPLEDLTSVIIETAVKQPSAKASKLLDVLEILVISGSLTWNEWQEKAEFQNISRSTFNRLWMELKKSGQIIKKNAQWEAV